MCDGLGACLVNCPQGAITVESREAEPYNETEVMTIMIDKGEATVIAHLLHLQDHNETEFLKEGLDVLNAEKENLGFNLETVMDALSGKNKEEESACGCSGSAPQAIKPLTMTPMGGCPGSAAQEIKPAFAPVAAHSGQSELQQWPVQMHLINPNAGFFAKSDFLLAADCCSFSMGNFHSEYLKGKMLGIACPKLDSNKESYTQKLISLIDDAKINTLTVMIMEVPCCGGLIALAQQAVAMATRNVPIKKIVVSISGEIVSEDWV
jgi:ferredoxin